jgi:hypothetical protein
MSRYPRSGGFIDKSAARLRLDGTLIGRLPPNPTLIFVISADSIVVAYNEIEAVTSPEAGDLKSIPN